MSEPTHFLWQGHFQVPFYWADPAGFMFFGYVYLAAQSQWEAWARSHPEAWSLWFESKELAYPLKHSSADYHQPMRFGEIFDVTIRVQSTTESSFVLLTEFSKQSKIYATVQTVHTALDLHKLKKGLINVRFLASLTGTK